MGFAAGICGTSTALAAGDLLVAEVAMMSAESGFFAMPMFLTLLMGMPVVALWVLLWGVRHRRKVASLFPGRTGRRVLPASMLWRRGIRAVLLLSSLLLIIFALAEPRYGKHVHLFEQKGVDLVVILDLSSSMDAKDVDPSRIERARREVSDLVDILEGDRVGLVIFAGGAYPRMPLTLDHDALLMLVEEVSTRDFQIQGSAMGDAIREGVKLLTADETSTAGRAILLMSDGEVHDPAGTLEAGAEAASSGVQIYSLGIGVEPSPIPLPEGGYLRDQDGQVVMSRPSPDVLIELARMTGGAYNNSVPSNSDVQSLYTGGVRKSLEAGLTGERQSISWQSGFQWPLGIAVLFTLFAAWLGDGRRRFGAAAALLLAVGLSTPHSGWAAGLADGDRAYRNGDYNEAIRVFSELLMEEPQNTDLYDRLGTARYRNGDFDGAARSFSEKSRLEGRENPNTLFNLGNAYYQSGRLEDAIDQYQAALERNPEYTGAERNKEMAEQEIVARRRLQPPPPEQQQSEQSGSDSEDQEDSSEKAPQDSQQQQGPNSQNPQGKPGEEGEQDEQDGDSGKSEQGSSGQTNEKSGQQQRKSGEGEEASQKAGGQKNPGNEQEKEGEDTTDAVSPESLEGGDEQTGEGQGGTSPGGEAAGNGKLTAQEAEELLDGVEEGRPRVVVPGRSEGKPW
jgi:Ca-activated chloride channel family protein